jgi:GT2 family glycosyltransferase
MKSKLAVIVLNFKKYSDTKACLRSIIASDLPKGSLLIVVDNSKEQKKQRELQKTFPDVHLLVNKTNVGFAAGNNRGIKFALKEKCDKVLIINPDVIVPPKFFAPLMTAMQTNKLNIAAPAIRHQANNKTLYGLEGSVDWQLAKPSHINVTTKPRGNLRLAQFVTFACVLITTETFSNIGLLDERYFMYLEDVDYCLTLHKHGGKIAVIPNIIVRHKTSNSFAKPTQKLAFVSQ